MVIKYTNIARPSIIYPKWDFWFENKPSGNPELMSKLSVNIVRNSKTGWPDEFDEKIAKNIAKLIKFFLHKFYIGKKCLKHLDYLCKDLSKVNNFPVCM
jgi:hypothetical protein